MERERRFEELIEPTLNAMGYELVRVVVSGRHRPQLQVMAERRDGRPMTVEDCAEISRALSAKLDVEDPIAGPYTLEVSSPGIDRPLVRPADFARFAGHVARVEMKAPFGGRRRFTGSIVAASEASVTMTIDEGEVELPLSGVARAKLVLTDELIAAAKGALTRH
ncbi:MAG TPA: ribosome maturation factor RimP [Alphaproteobacteria bacterium]|nr:ribosome maturation factor RimP [Alphaproteobacteria bacterium]